MRFLYLKKFSISKDYLIKTLFYIGLFLLPSAFSISAIILLISLILNSLINEENIFKDKLNIFFFLGSFLLIISSIMHDFRSNYLSYDPNSSLSWIGLANWIPFFWCYWGFKPLLNNSEKRKKTSLILLSGTLPVLITGLGQSFFNWDGPFEIFNGLIVWYQRPLEGITGLTGLFNNPNYAGSWLNVIWPFCIAALLDKTKYLAKNISVYLFTLGISLSTILTNSRSAWIGFIIGTLFVFGKKSFKLITNLLIIISLIISATIFPIFGSNIQLYLQNIVPESIWMEFNDFQYSRIEIWHKGFEIVFNNPIFGTGAGSFPEIFKLETGLWKGHAHNLPLELIISYGIPTGIVILIPIFFIIFNSINKILITKARESSSIYDQSWIAALVVLFFSQMVDVQYFDGRISIIFWILLSGARNIIKKDKETVY
ncbi:O-antigen ligase [uncultured Prochlorococcus sp.]|uniref:O-antigen ligase family protein n=1 Tax=uncultured Prochlorococcus sp. TaxID=159733 RepID=UPI00258BB286|nr:O-antigen ligase family protein [uncultured Prochlorococcus sp.]